MTKISDKMRECVDTCCVDYVDKADCDELRDLADRVDKEMAELPRDRDGVPIHVGDTVYGEDGREWHVCGVTIGESPTSWEDHDVHATNDSNEFESFGSMQITHERPDSWEKLERDVMDTRDVRWSLVSCRYYRHDTEGSCVGCPARSEDNCENSVLVDIIRRAKALAGVAE